MSDKLNINNEMRQLDRKNRNFYDELTDEERKKFSNYLMIRWSSDVETDDPRIAAYYLMSCNENLNKNFFDINKHPKLQWLCATAVSPNIGIFKHKWVKPKPKEKGSNAIKKQLLELYPNLKMDEIDMLCTMTTERDLKQLMRDHGNSD